MTQASSNVWIAADQSFFQAGQATIPLGASQVVVTDAFITTATRVFAQLAAADTTLLYIKNAIPVNGSVTINGNAAATVATPVNYLLVNPS